MRLLPLILCLSLAACAGSPTAQPSETPQAIASAADSTEAVAALQKVDSAIDVGLNIGQYSELLVEAKPVVDRYLLQDSGSETAEHLKRSMDGYLVALDWWRCDLERDILVEQNCRRSALAAIEQMYPDISQQVDTAVANKGGIEALGERSNAVDYKALMRSVWQKAEADLRSINP